MEKILHVGLDVGSTTVKIIVMDSNKNTIYKGKVYVKERIITPNTVKPEESKSPEPSLDISPSPTTPTEETPEPTE